jgi:hypothetical protein
MEYGPSWGSYGRWVSQEIPWLLCEPNVRYRFNKDI